MNNDRSPSTDTGDEELLQSLARREDGAAEQFIDRFKPLIWTLAQRYCSNIADAEDALQDILLELWRKVDRFDPERGRAKTFVATVARRRLIDRLRRSSTRPPMEEIPEGAASSEVSPECRAMVSAVSNAVRQLESKHRDVLSMSLVQGYSHGEIADIMKLPLGTVKTIARRSVRRVRTELRVA